MRKKDYWRDFYQKSMTLVSLRIFQPSVGFQKYPISQDSLTENRFEKEMDEYLLTRQICEKELAKSEENVLNLVHKTCISQLRAVQELNSYEISIFKRFYQNVIIFQGNLKRVLIREALMPEKLKDLIYQTHLLQSQVLGESDRREKPPMHIFYKDFYNLGVLQKRKEKKEIENLRKYQERYQAQNFDLPLLFFDLYLYPKGMQPTLKYSLKISPENDKQDRNRIFWEHLLKNSRKYTLPMKSGDLEKCEKDLSLQKVQLTASLDENNKIIMTEYFDKQASPSSRKRFLRIKKNGILYEEKLIERSFACQIRETLETTFTNKQLECIREVNRDVPMLSEYFWSSSWEESVYPLFYAEAHNQVSRIITEVLQNNPHKQFNILDAGCGLGILGGKILADIEKRKMTNLKRIWGVEKSVCKLEDIKDEKELYNNLSKILKNESKSKIEEIFQAYRNPKYKIYQGNLTRLEEILPKKEHREKADIAILSGIVSKHIVSLEDAESILFNISQKVCEGGLLIVLNNTTPHFNSEYYKSSSIGFRIVASSIPFSRTYGSSFHILEKRLFLK